MRLVLDVETTIKNKGNPFTKENKLVVVGVKDIDTNEYWRYWNDYSGLQEKINNCSLLIGFNIKFDLHWIRRAGISFGLDLRVWDCQLAEFVLENQATPYPSLQGTCEKYGLPGKLDVVKTEYWEKGIDTDQIPQDILKEYLLGDLDATQQVFEKQDKLLVENQRKLFSLQCQDLLVLQEMEFNGIYINVKEALRCADEEDAKAREVEKQLQQGYENIPINWDSNDHLSCYLYGGTIVDTVRLPIGVYKSGAKIGQPRYKLVDYEYKLARMVEPLRGSELKKEGYYATNDPTLRSLKATKEARRRVNLILERAKSVKLSGTYYRGLPKLIETMDWPSGILHGQFNQCVAATGRLSSSKPNLQNFAAEVKTLLETRYG